MAELTAHGITVDVPPTWEGRIFVRPQTGEVATQAYQGEAAPPGERTQPLLQVASVPMPNEVGDYGSGVVEILTAADLLIVVKMFSADAATAAMFSRKGMPLPLDPEQFNPNSLQRTLPGQAGIQVFFNQDGGAYCLYVVIGSYARRVELAKLASDVLATVRLPTRAAPTTVTTAPPATTSTTAPPSGTVTPTTAPSPPTSPQTSPPTSPPTSSPTGP